VTRADGRRIISYENDDETFTFTFPSVYWFLFNRHVSIHASRWFQNEGCARVTTLWFPFGVFSLDSPPSPRSPRWGTPSRASR